MNTIVGFQRATTAQFATPPRQVEWLWQGYLARGAMTLLTSQWKAGKTTLISVLLKQLAAGGELAGLPVAPASAVVVTEERLDFWQRRGERLRFGDNLTFLCRTPAVESTHESWHALVDHLEGLGREQGVGLVVIDPLAPFLPSASENMAATIGDAITPLQRLTAAGLAVLLLHHPRKGRTAPGQAARGSGALCALVDVMIEMRLPGRGNSTSRRRRLQAWSRFDATPRNRTIELSEDGTAYSEVVIDPTAAAGDRGLISVIETLLSQPPRMLTRLQILTEWPRQKPPPNVTSLWRALERAVRSGDLDQEGTGRRNDPFRYGLPGLNAPWTPSLEETSA